MKKQNCKTSINSNEARKRRKSDYIFTGDEENVSMISNKAPDIMQYVSNDTIKKSKIIILKYIENNSRNSQITNVKVNQWTENSKDGVIISSQIVLSCFATHDGIIKNKIETGFSNQKLSNSGRKSHNVSVKANESNYNNYLKLNYKTINNSINSSNSNRIWMRTGRGLSFKWENSKKNPGLFGDFK